MIARCPCGALVSPIIDQQLCSSPVFMCASLVVVDRFRSRDWPNMQAS
jgi:hypothetical protein